MLTLFCLPQLSAQDRLRAEPRRDVANQTPHTVTSSSDSESTVSTTAAPLPSTVNGAEFGEQLIVSRRAHVEPWSLSLMTDVFHTDNVGLTNTDEKRDWYFRTGASIGYINRIRGPVFADFSLEQYFFRYARFDVADFDLTRFQAGFLVQTPWKTDAFLFFRYRLERITEEDFGSSIFNNHVAEIGLQKTWKISRGMQIYTALSADIALSTDPRSSSRNEYAADLGYSLRLTEQLTAGLSYRGSFYDYTRRTREDWNHILSAGITCDFTDWLRLGLNFSYSRNYSNESFAEYSNLLPGGSIALRLSF